MSFSTNQINGTKYKIPEQKDDKKNIDSFLLKNKNKPVVVVQGLGFVGSVMALVCANSKKKDYAVIGIDLPTEFSYWKIKSINEGVFPIISSDKKIDKYYKNSIKQGNFYASYDSYAYSKADIIIVDINLDVFKLTSEKGDLKNFDVNLNPFKKAIQEIGSYCRDDVLIIVETTVPPGTCNKVVYPIIKSSLEHRGLSSEKFMIGHSYERVMPGPNYIDSIENFYRVFSGIDEKSIYATEQFLKTIISTSKYPLTMLKNTNATEIAKVLENSYRAMNIAFMVEWSRFAEESGVNLYEIVDAIRMRPTHNNLMYPGIGVGGYCLTKDPLLASWSKINLFESKENLNQSITGVKINDKMPLYAYNVLKNQIKDAKLNVKNVLLLGVSYRSDVADTRYTPVELFYDLLLAENLNVILHDPYVNYWEEKDIYISNNLDECFKKNIDLVVYSTSHTDYKNSNKLNKLINNRKNLFIFDTVGVLSEDEIQKFKINHIVRVLGRGDIT